MGLWSIMHLHWLVATRLPIFYVINALFSNEK